ncbi:MAG: hypothetical protein ACFCGT_01140 [Sandaracinaceae bacterium]
MCGLGSRGALAGVSVLIVAACGGERAAEPTTRRGAGGGGGDPAVVAGRPESSGGSHSSAEARTGPPAPGGEAQAGAPRPGPSGQEQPADEEPGRTTGGRPLDAEAEAALLAAPFPDDRCPDPDVYVRHVDAPELPRRLDRAVALRAPDGKTVLVALGSSPLARDRLGRFGPPGPGQVRFEFEGLRTRRGPLREGRLRRPNGRRAAYGRLVHARIVSPGPLFPFGDRVEGAVELTRVDAEMVCGRIDLDDGRGRVRGAFRAPVIDTL